MGEPSLPVVVTCGERCVCHAVDPDLPAGELAAALALYLAFPGTIGPPVWRAADGPRPLDPSRPLGAQIPPDAEIDFPLHP